VLLSSDKGEMRKQLESLLQQYPKIVVKPTDGAHGDGVVTDITDIDEAMSAAVATCSKDGKCNAIAQEQLQGEETEIRAICIGGKFVAAYKRIPAMVTGDGEHNIWELIEKENDELRTEAYRGDFPKIDIKGAKDYIEKHAVDTSRVPERGEKVRVMTMCNVGMGGTTEEIELEPSRVALSEKIADITELPVVGIDYYGDKVIEINSGPSLYWPVRENGDKCVRAYADYLEQI
jgi:cyanophycin synthetase